MPRVEVVKVENKFSDGRRTNGWRLSALVSLGVKILMVLTPADERVDMLDKGFSEIQLPGRMYTPEENKW